MYKVITLSVFIFATGARTCVTVMRFFANSSDKMCHKKSPDDVSCREI